MIGFPFLPFFSFFLLSKNTYFPKCRLQDYRCCAVVVQASEGEQRTVPYRRDSFFGNKKLLKFFRVMCDNVNISYHKIYTSTTTVYRCVEARGSRYSQTVV